MRLLAVVAVVFAIIFSLRDVRAEQPQAAPPKSSKKIKIPHDHSSVHGGLVVMVGDDHFEFSRVSARELKAFITDKLRDPVPVHLFQMQLVVVDGNQRTPLAPSPIKNEPAAFTVSLPAGLSSQAKVELRAPRIAPVKGQVSTSNPQMVDLTKIPEGTNHSLHKMGK